MERNLEDIMKDVKSLLSNSDKTLKEMEELKECVSFALNEWKTNKRWFREEPGHVTTEDVIKMCIEYGWASRGHFEHNYQREKNNSTYKHCGASCDHRNCEIGSSACSMCEKFITIDWENQLVECKN